MTENKKSKLVKIPGEELIEAIGTIDYNNWTYLENQGEVTEIDGNKGYITGEGVFDGETLHSYLTELEDRGLYGEIHVFGPEELGDSLAIRLEQQLDREEYEERVGDIEYVPDFPEATQFEKFDWLQITEIPPEIKDVAIDYL